MLKNIHVGTILFNVILVLNITFLYFEHQSFQNSFQCTNSIRNITNNDSNFISNNTQILVEKKTDKIAIFFNVGTKGQNWFNKFKQVEQALEKSGLLNNTNHAFLCIVGTTDIILNVSKKWRILTLSSNIIFIYSLNKKRIDSADLYEFPTIQMLYSFSLIDEDYNILYIHVQDVVLVVLFVQIPDLRIVFKYIRKVVIGSGS